MQDGDNRALIFDTARTLFERNPDGFTIVSVCRETGLSRAKLRRHFPTKKSLIACIHAKAEQDALPAAQLEIKSEKIPSETDSAIVACEQAPAPLETKSEASGSKTALAPLASELPPIVAQPPPALVARPDAAAPSRAASQVRERALQILAKAEEARQAAPQPAWTIKLPAMPRLAAAAGLAFVVLVVSASLISFDGLARATQPPPAPIQAKHVAAVPEVLIIDATGAAPDPMYQETPPALRDVVARARRGETKAQVQLAQSFLKGDGFAADPIAAARWSDEAAAQGDATAQFILGSLYAEGIEPSPRLAFDWFSAAASRGNVKAMHNLAIAYLNGTGVAQDSKAAAAWFEKAASAGYRDSAFDLAVLYERGEGVAQDSGEALKWYEQAASFGDPEAMQRATYLRSWQVAKR